MKRPLLTIAASTLLSLGLVVPAFAATTKAVPKTVDTACMATAVSTRDSSISTALATVGTALQTRGQALAAAWKIADPKAQKAALKAANTAFDGSWKTFNAARTAAWNQYKTAAKTCHATPDTPSTSMGM